MAGQSVKKVIFRACALFKETFAKHQEIRGKLDDFRRLKSQDPLARFGKTDQHFQGEGPLKGTGLIHAHLTGDISLLYGRHGRDPTVIDLYMVATHDELGTGQPGNIKQQRKVAKTMMGQTFEGTDPPGPSPGPLAELHGYRKYAG